MKGAAEKWHKPFESYLRVGNWYVLIPFAILLFNIIVFILRKRKPMDNLSMFIYVYLFFSCLIILYFHNIGKTAIFLHFAFIYILPATYLGTAKIFAVDCLKSLDWKNWQLFVVFCIIFIGLHLERFWIPELEKMGISIVILSSSLFFLGPIFLCFPQKIFGLGLFFLGFTLMPLCTATHRVPFRGVSQTDENAAIKIGEHVSNLIKIHAPYKNGPMRLWVPIPKSPVVRCITAMNFWGYSLISLGDKKGMPDVEREIAKKNLQGVKYLVLVSDVGRDLIGQGLINIFKETGDSWTPIIERHLENKLFRVDLTIAENKTVSQLSEKVQYVFERGLPMAKIIPIGEGKGKFESGSFVFETDARLWANSASLVIPEKLTAGKTALLIKLKVESGMVQLYVLGDQEKRTMPASYLVSAGTDNYREIYRLNVEIQVVLKDQLN